MPRGVRGYRWVRTGPDYWLLEDTPKHYRGGVLALSDGSYAWYLGGGSRIEGESPTRRAAMNEVERRVIRR